MSSSSTPVTSKLREFLKDVLPHVRYATRRQLAPIVNGWGTMTDGSLQKTLKRFAGEGWLLDTGYRHQGVTAWALPGEETKQIQHDLMTADLMYALWAATMGRDYTIAIIARKKMMEYFGEQAIPDFGFRVTQRTTRQALGPLYFVETCRTDARPEIETKVRFYLQRESELHTQFNVIFLLGGEVGRLSVAALNALFIYLPYPAVDPARILKAVVYRGGRPSHLFPAPLACP